MEIRDVLHGPVNIESHELPIVDSGFFQRLRQIKQLGFAEYSFPSATHNRYIHSVGALMTATRAIEAISDSSFPGLKALPRFRACVRLAALLHDIGHGPLSHTTEFAMPSVESLALPVKTGRGRKATHEDYTLKILLDSSLTPALEKAGKGFGFTPMHLASLIEGSIEPPDDFFIEKWEGAKIDFRPLLGQLISSELDSDRMDYLRRDSLVAGVSYGVFDFDWLVRNLTGHVENGRAFLALRHRALYSFEDFLISRFHMFLMVYFHYKSVIYDEMLKHYLRSPDCPYRIPADVEEYLGFHDAHLSAHLGESKDPWAKRISTKRPYRLLVELHSGIPATKRAQDEQESLLRKIEGTLKKEAVHSISVTSTGELSKYFGKRKDPIFIHYDNGYSEPMSIPLEKCTDLFDRYREKRSIHRIYVSPEDYPRFRHLGRGEKLPFEED